MDITSKEYAKLVECSVPKSPVLKNCMRAFFVGGLICFIGQIITELFTGFGMELQDSRCLAIVTLVFLGAFFTALGLYDNIAKYAGAGTLVPITGFSNAVASPAMEFKSEGFVPGVGAKMFIIAGPVIVYGTVASVIYGAVYFLMQGF